MRSKLISLIYLVCSPFLIRRGNGNSVYLTFDDGPHPLYTPAILTTLRKFGAKATFFVVGNEVEKYPEVFKQIINDGHSVGYHSYQHQSLKNVTFAELLKDLAVYKKIMSTFKIRRKIYRPPYGDLSLIGMLWLALTGWKIIMWSRDSRDSFDDAVAVKNNVAPPNVRGGDILLFHDDYQQTAEVLGEILTTFNSTQYRLAPL